MKKVGEPGGKNKHPTRLYINASTPFVLFFPKFHDFLASVEDRGHRIQSRLRQSQPIRTSLLPEIVIVSGVQGNRQCIHTKPSDRRQQNPSLYQWICSLPSYNFLHKVHQFTRRVRYAYFWAWSQGLLLECMWSKRCAWSPGYIPWRTGAQGDSRDLYLTTIQRKSGFVSSTRPARVTSIFLTCYNYPRLKNVNSRLKIAEHFFVATVVVTLDLIYLL